jgi:hypothetical protein
MGTIVGRTRKDGSKAFTAQIMIKKGGAIVHRESQSFDRKQAANAWIVKREAELKSTGGLEKKEDPTLGAVIDRYVAESKSTVLGTKAQVLKTIKNSELGERKCSEITSQTLVTFARDLTRSVEPQTCANYFSHLSNIFTVARPAWGYPLSREAFDDALTVLRKLGLIRKSMERNRRPTLEELDRLMEHFGRIRDHRPSSIPMQKIVLFALFSTRRQEEITLLRWDDLDATRPLICQAAPARLASHRQLLGSFRAPPPLRGLSRPKSFQSDSLNFGVVRVDGEKPRLSGARARRGVAPQEYEDSTTGLSEPLWASKKLVLVNASAPSSIVEAEHRPGRRARSIDTPNFPQTPGARRFALTPASAERRPLSRREASAARDLQARR